jgi:excisionase family DNA binding protein
MTELLTYAEVAQRLRVSERTVRRLVRAGRIRPRYVGRKPVITTRELEAFLAASTKPGRLA